MGKLKRARQKFHLSSDKSKSEDNNREIRDTVINASNSDLNDGGVSWNIKPNDNIFAGLDIDVNVLKKSLQDVDDDGKSVRSISKSIKSCTEKQLKKSDKHKLRHNLFIQKIDAIYEKIKNNKKKGNKKSKTPAIPEEKSTVEYLLDKNPIKVKNTPPTSLKKRATKTAKERKKMMLKDVDLFKRILSDSNYVKNPLDHVRSSVQDKVVASVV